MRASVGDGKVLKTARDPGTGMLTGAKDFCPDWNLEDITSSPDFFLDRLKFRVEADLQTQHFEGELEFYPYLLVLCYSPRLYLVAS